MYRNNIVKPGQGICNLLKTSQTYRQQKLARIRPQLPVAG